ncbi:hypothetical protein C8R44DRAFT_786728 [Mycena epipterygia]|nr:hypothetical protein C8R44DRAFT_786728 [Mycena epipterygia]
MASRRALSLLAFSDERPATSTSRPTFAYRSRNIVPPQYGHEPESPQVRNRVRGTFRTTPYHRERARNGEKSYLHPDVQLTRKPLGLGNRAPPPTSTSARAPIASISSNPRVPLSPINLTLHCTCGVGVICLVCRWSTGTWTMSVNQQDSEVLNSGMRSDPKMYRFRLRDGENYSETRIWISARRVRRVRVTAPVRGMG